MRFAHALVGLVALLPLAHVASAAAPAPYQTNIEEQARQNTDFRRVLFTGTRTQVVVMSIPPAGEIGFEAHARVEQLLVCVSGHGEAIVDGRVEPFGPGEMVVVTPGARHNFVNRGLDPLKLYTVYAPPNHLDQRVQATKADADGDTADEAFGESVESVE
jgi:mannose-6-phosphate isomerase-like protein (cupin superfamily)